MEARAITPPATSVGPLAERYEVGEILGIGGTATVHRAIHRGSGREVAVKIFAPGVVGADALPGQRTVAAVLAEVRHPGLVEIHESGVDGDRIYLVMRLVEGGSLSARFADGPLPGPEVAAMGAVLADALAHVHERGVVHRDIKPSNVLLDGHGRPFLTDFGVSRLVDTTRVTATGMTVGTPAFMAPEQVRGERVGPPADVYALGLVLLEAATGRREYPGGVVESAVARLHRDPAVPADLPGPLRRALIAMTVRDAASRPSAAAVAAALRPGAETTRAWPVPASDRRRGTWIAAAAAAVLLAPVVSGLMDLTGGADPATAVTAPLPAAGQEQPSASAAPPGPAVAGAAGVTPRPVAAGSVASGSGPGAGATRSGSAGSGSTGSGSAASAVTARSIDVAAPRGSSTGRPAGDRATDDGAPKEQKAAKNKEKASKPGKAGKGRS